MRERAEVEAVERVLESLDYRERRVLTLRFGIGGERVQSYPEIARQLRVRPGRIREIEESALKRLAAKRERSAARAAPSVVASQRLTTLRRSSAGRSRSRTKRIAEEDRPAVEVALDQ